MERFLRDLEKHLAKSSPAERARLVDGLKLISKGCSALGGTFKPSAMGALGVLKELMYGVSSGRPFAKTVDKAKAQAGKIGPHVDAFLRAL
jgi:hypothetical protein